MLRSISNSSVIEAWPCWICEVTLRTPCGGDHLLLDLVDDLRFHHLRRGAAPRRVDRQHGKIDIGLLTDAESRKADRAENNQRGHQHPREDGTPDRQIGQRREGRTPAACRDWVRLRADSCLAAWLRPSCGQRLVVGVRASRRHARGDVQVDQVEPRLHVRVVQLDARGLVILQRGQHVEIAPRRRGGSRPLAPRNSSRPASPLRAARSPARRSR